MFTRYLRLSLLFLFPLAFTTCSAPRSPASTVRVRWAQDPESLDPLTNPNLYAQEASNLLHLSLLTLNNETEQIEPWLADTIPQVQHTDSLTLLTYHLRNGAKWDNGQPVSARDVAFTLKMMNCPGLPNEAMQARFGFISDIQLDSSDVTRFTLVCRGKSPEYLAESGFYSILPEHALDPTGSLRPFALPTFRRNPVALLKDPAITAFAKRYRSARLANQPENLPGCGPYRLTKWLSNQYLSFERKADWWADRLPRVPPQLRANPSTINFQIIPDPATALLALQQGTIDVYPMMPAQDFSNLQRSAAKEKLAFYTSSSYEVMTVGFNTARPILRDKLTRQALSHLFDVPALIKATQGGIAQPSVGLINPANQYYYNDSLPLLAYDLTTATALLTQAGWQRQLGGSWYYQVRQGVPAQLALSISYRPTDPVAEQIALQFQTAAKKLGIPVRLRPTDVSLMTTQLRAGNFDMYVRNTAGGPRAFNFAPILHSRSIGVNNYTGFNNLANDRLIEAIAKEEDTARKIRMLHKFQALLQDESPLIPLFFFTYRLAANRQLTNLHPSAIKPGYEVMAITTAPAATQSQ